VGSDEATYAAETINRPIAIRRDVWRMPTRPTQEALVSILEITKGPRMTRSKDKSPVSESVIEICEILEDIGDSSCAIIAKEHGEWTTE